MNIHTNQASDLTTQMNDTILQQKAETEAKIREQVNRILTKQEWRQDWDQNKDTGQHNMWCKQCSSDSEAQLPLNDWTLWLNPKFA